MVTFIPQKPESFNNSFGEEKIFEALHLLPREYYIFHSFEWINNSKGMIQGEADFLIYNLKRGIIVIEVKSGKIECKDRQWFQTNMYNNKKREIGDPMSQASRSKFKIIDLIGKYKSECLVCHAVWFPSISFKSCNLPANYANEIILDLNSLSDPERDINTVFSYWEKSMRRKTNLSDFNSKIIIELLAPEFMAVPSIQTIIDAREKHFVRLTKEQANILNYLEEQRTAAIHGGAGTGKTILAIEKVKKLASRGEKVLFLCYNSFLRNFLKKTQAIPDVEFHNVHSLAYDCLGKISFDIKLLPQKLVNWLKSCEDNELWPYHHVVIDEGQDLDDNLIIQLYKNTKKSFYVFYDRNQLIQKNILPEWVEHLECRLVLHKNCRNTAEISRTASSVLSLEKPISDDIVRGEKPLIYFHQNKSEALINIKKIVNKYIKEGLHATDIVILTTKTEENSIMNGIKSINNYTTTNEYLTDGILFTTVRKFKGLEAKVIILIDITKSTFEDENKRRIFYVGSSRAKHNLHIFIQISGEKDIQSIVEVLAGSRRIPRNVSGMVNFLKCKLFK